MRQFINGLGVYYISLPPFKDTVPFFIRAPTTFLLDLDFAMLRARIIRRHSDRRYSMPMIREDAALLYLFHYVECTDLNGNSYLPFALATCKTGQPPTRLSLSHGTGNSSSTHSRSDSGLQTCSNTLRRTPKRYLLRNSHALDCGVLMVSPGLHPLVHD